MATLARKIAAEDTLRSALAAQGVPAPDAIEYGYTCIRAIWFRSKLALVIDLDDPDDPGCVTESGPGPGEGVRGSGLGEALGFRIDEAGFWPADAPRPRPHDM